MGWMSGRRVGAAILVDLAAVLILLALAPDGRCNDAGPDGPCSTADKVVLLGLVSALIVLAALTVLAVARLVATLLVRLKDSSNSSPR